MGLIEKCIVGAIIAILILCFVSVYQSASYESRITGYTFWECLWAGDAIKNVNVKVRK